MTSIPSTITHKSRLAELPLLLIGWIEYLLIVLILIFFLFGARAERISLLLCFSPLLIDRLRLLTL